MSKLNEALKSNNHVLGLLSTIAIITTLWIGIQSIKIGNKSNQIILLDDVQKRDIVLGQNIILYNLLIDSLIDTLNNATPDNYYIIYVGKKYFPIRELGYHYEYLGLLVKRNMIPIDLIYEMIIIPDDLWNRSTPFVKIMRENIANDFWSNFEFLINKYNQQDRIANNSE